MDNNLPEAVMTAKGRYEKNVGTRQAFLDRAYRCAELTIPSLLPREGHTATAPLPTPYQSIGARGVNNLGSKLLLSLFPANAPFFRMVIDDFTLEKLTGKDDMRGEIEAGLNKIERAVIQRIETSAIRVSVFEGMKQLVVAGNVLLHILPEGGMRAYRLDRYTVKRDPDGNVLEIIAMDHVSPSTLTPELLDKLKQEPSYSADKNVELYTRIYLEDGKFKSYQEMCGEILEETRGDYPIDSCPWLALRLNKIDGEDYGRGHVEEYLGDLSAADGLSRAVLEGSVAAAKLILLVNPNGVTEIDDLAEAENGDFVSGKDEDVSAVQANKAMDMRVAADYLKVLEERLSFAFLLNSAIQRNAERVTAEEIRYMAGELEEALGGVYSILSNEFQLPFVKRILAQLTKQNKIPKLPKGTVTPSIVTGVEALGRGNDADRLRQLFSTIAETFGPEALAQRVNPGEAFKRLGASFGVDMKGLVKDDEQIAQEQQQSQQQSLIQTAAPQGVAALGKIAAEGMKQQQAQPQGA